MSTIDINIKGNVPKYMSQEASGCDLRSNMKCIIGPYTMKLVTTGTYIELPKGFEAQIRTRSGLAFNNQIIVLNSPGTIDSDYRGEIKLIMFNLGVENFVVNEGDRLAQMVFCKSYRGVFNIISEQTNEVDSGLSVTQRMDNGFGSTGVNDSEK